MRLRCANHWIRQHNGQPHFAVRDYEPGVKSSADGEAFGSSIESAPCLRALGPSGTIHQFFAGGESSKLNEEWIAWYSIPVGAPLEIREAVRFLPLLYGRRWMCAVTGCKEQSAKFTRQVSEAAWTAGQLAAELGWTVLTGGLTGVMSRAAEGAKSVGGITVGVLPGEVHGDANSFIDFVLPSAMGYARNYLLAAACDLMISLPGGTGTLEEMCFALDFKRPVISWGGWEIEGIRAVPLNEPQIIRERIIEVMKAKYAIIQPTFNFSQGGSPS